MATRLTAVVVDSADPATLAQWWRNALGWVETYADEDEVEIGPPPGEPGIPLTFVPVADPRSVKNRVHLDLRSESEDHQRELVARLGASGATSLDIGQGDAPWVVLADPEGNEFCVLEPREEYARTGSVAAILVDALDPEALAGFWAHATGWERHTRPEEVGLRAPDGTGPYLEFAPTKEPHSVKNRLHLDVAGHLADDQAEEVSRLLNLGALRVEVGQSQAAEGEVTWVVLADPENNEFCVLSSRD